MGIMFENGVLDGSYRTRFMYVLVRRIIIKAGGEDLPLVVVNWMLYFINKAYPCYFYIER